MSADNWAVCPRCQADWHKKEQERAISVAQAYGKVPLDEWESMRKEPFVAPDMETFREDYSIGIDEDVFSVSYYGHCDKCGLKHEYKFTQDVDINQPRTMAAERKRK